MAIGIDDLDDDDILLAEDSEQQPSVWRPSEQEEPVQQEEPKSDLMSDFLKSKGIDDMSRIKFEDENNNIVERSWDDLSREEQLNIMNTPLDDYNHTDDSNSLSEEEINLINSIRNSQLTPEQFINQLIQNAEPTEPTYKVDDLSDDEIYILDLESRVGELSDEEAANALNIAKQNEEFYKKQVDGIRKEYKDREDFQSQQELNEIEQQQQAAFEEYQYKIVDAINGFNSIGNLDLNFEDSDKEELAEFILSQDNQGNNYLYKALQDPQILTKAAWFILNGEDAINNISDYFINQIKQVSENQYKKGLEDGRKGKTSKLVIDNSKKTSRRVYKDINDLDDDE